MTVMLDCLFGVCNVNKYVAMFVDELSSDGQGQLEHKLEKMMINEFSRPWLKNRRLIPRLSMPPWKKLTLRAVHLEESYFHQFQVGFLLGLSVILLTPCMIFPWSQPIYQNVLEIYLEVDIFYIAWLCCKYPLRFHTCHDYTTLLYNSFFRKMFFPTLDLELILLVVRKSKTAYRPTEFMVHGKVFAKKGQEFGHWKF